MHQVEKENVSYVREHYNQEVRKGLFDTVKERETAPVVYEKKGRKRKKQRVWTLNRSPHGNKTAREQFGRQIWQRTIQASKEKGSEVDPLSRRKQVIQMQKVYVTRKEKKLG